MKDTVYFIVISLIMVVMAYFVAFGCEKLIEKKTHVKFSSEKTKVNKLVIMAMLSAVAVVGTYTPPVKLSAREAGCLKSALKRTTPSSYTLS